MLYVEEEKMEYRNLGRTGVKVSPPGGAALPNYYNADFGPHHHRW